jgi:uncharacterized membrane protein
MPSKLVQLLAAGAVGAVAGGVTVVFSPWQAAVLVGWIAAALSWTVPVWLVVARLDAKATRRLATHEDPHGAAADTLLVAASVASLGAVVLGLIRASNATGANRVLLFSAGVGAVVVAWAVVHTVFALRYAALYYRTEGGAVDFNEKEEPDYGDFAYLAFTIGMTYQVSDTTLRSKVARRTVLRHALLSYLLGTVVIAATINIAAGLAH